MSPVPPLQSMSRCGWQAAAGAAAASWSFPATAPGAACATTAPAPAAPPPSAASWAVGTGAACRPSPPRSRPVPGWPGCAARTGPARSGAAPRPPGTCRAAALAGMSTWLVRRTAMAWLRQTLPHIRRVPAAQVALPVPASPRPGWLGSPLLTACLCPKGLPSSSTVAVAVGTVPVGTVPVWTVLCVVLGTLLCLSLGALAVLLCRARARREGGSRWVGAGTAPVWGSSPGEELRRWGRADPSAQGPREVLPVVAGPGRAADAVSNAVYEELDYSAMREYQEVPSGPGGCSPCAPALSAGKALPDRPTAALGPDSPAVAHCHGPGWPLSPTAAPFCSVRFCHLWCHLSHPQVPVYSLQVPCRRDHSRSCPMRAGTAWRGVTPRQPQVGPEGRRAAGSRRREDTAGLGS